MRQYTNKINIWKSKFQNQGGTIQEKNNGNCLTRNFNFKAIGRTFWQKKNAAGAVNM